MISRIDIGTRVTGGTQDLASKQLMWTALGVVGACAVVWFLKDHRTLRRYSYTAMIVGLVLVAMPLLPVIGRNINGARIWVNIAGMSLQPAEFAKIAFAIFFAGYLVTNRDTLALAGPKVLGSSSRACATSARWSSCGRPRSRSSSSSATWAPRSCSSASSSPCCTSPPSASAGS
ncbi:FtsW/RodA/SpoVE family cell cycle protein [Oerskovia sp. M15]